MSIIEKILLRKQEAALKKIARQEYELARGTSHGTLLRDAKIRIETKIKSNQREIDSLYGKLRLINTKLNARLKDRLDKYLLEYRLSEIPGIGNKLQQLLSTQVYKGELSDLRAAHQYPGIGESKQIMINSWVAKYERETPELLRGDFPGKTKITSEFTEKIDDINKEIKLLNIQIDGLTKLINIIDEKLKELNSVTVEDFIEARLNPDLWKPQIDRYLRGFFGEWESAPDWFKEIISVE